MDHGMSITLRVALTIIGICLLLTGCHWIAGYDSATIDDKGDASIDAPVSTDASGDLATDAPGDFATDAPGDFATDAPDDLQTDTTPATRMLTVSVTIVGNIEVSFNLPDGQRCTATCPPACTKTCSSPVTAGVVTFNLQLDPAVYSWSWQGDASTCGSSSTCTIQMNQDRHIELEIRYR
jgi:hypothetical protein